MSEPSADETFKLFQDQWVRRDPLFHLDEPKARNQVMILVSAAMSVLVLAPETMDAFVDGCANVAKTVVPPEAQEKIKAATKGT